MRHYEHLTEYRFMIFNLPGQNARLKIGRLNEGLTRNRLWYCIAKVNTPNISKSLSELHDFYFHASRRRRTYRCRQCSPDLETARANILKIFMCAFQYPPMFKRQWTALHACNLTWSHIWRAWTPLQASQETSFQMARTDTHDDILASACRADLNKGCAWTPATVQPESSTRPLLKSKNVTSETTQS